MLSAGRSRPTAAAQHSMRSQAARPGQGSRAGWGRVGQGRVGQGRAAKTCSLPAGRSTRCRARQGLQLPLAEANI